LSFLPWAGESPSDEICPCCGIQFGYDDAVGGDPGKRNELYARWRRVWVESGMKWFSKSTRPPIGWDPMKQLAQIGRRDRDEQERGN